MKQAKSNKKSKINTRLHWIIPCLAALAVIFVVVFLFLVNADTHKKDILLSVESPGISLGLNPDGSKFDINDMLDDRILEEVIKELNLKLTYADLSKSIVISPAYPSGIVDKITQSRKNGESYAFHPTEFKIALDASKLDDVDIETANQILTTLVDIYQKEFYSIYADKSILEGITNEPDFELFDYPDITKVIRNHINVISTYLSDKEKLAAGFRSEVTNLCFTDLVQSLEVTRDIDLARIDSMIDAYNLTKDKEKLILSYENMIKHLELEREKKLGESQKAREMMDIFERDKNLIYLTGTGSKIEGLDIGSYYNELTDRATEAKVLADNVNHDIEFYKKEIEKLNNDIISSGDNKQKERDMLTMLESLSNKLMSQKEEISKTVDEYNKRKIGNSFKVIK